MFQNFTNSELAMLALALIEDEKEENQTERSRVWVHNELKSRDAEGEFNTLFPRLIDDEAKFYDYFKMKPNTFHELLSALEIHLKKKDTFWRKAIPPIQRLAVCLRFLVTGDSFKAISFSYRLGKSTVAKIIHETCSTIVEILYNEVMPIPTAMKWNAIADEFWETCQFPNCIGSIEGKHIKVQAPRKSSILHKNIQESFSMVLWALVDSEFNFISVDVDACGKNSDECTFSNSKLGKLLENNKLDIPQTKCLPGTNIELPMVIIAHETFPLKTYMMRTYPGRNLTHDKIIYNKRLLRVRSMSENGFGNLQKKFGIFMRKLQGEPENLKMIITAACVMHNYIKNHEGLTQIEQNPCNLTHNSKNLWRPLTRIQGRSTDEAFNVREQFKEFFNSEELDVPR